MNYREQQIYELPDFKALFTLHGKNCLVTGAAGGIGRSSAAGMASLGADLILVDDPLYEDELKDNAEFIRSKYGVKVLWIAVDLSLREEADKMIASAEKEFGVIHAVHIVTEKDSFQDCPVMPVGKWEEMITLNLDRAFNAAGVCAESMKRSGQGGSIILTSMLAGLYTVSGAAYGASMAGIRHMSNALAIEYSKQGIRFNTVAYGHIVSEQNPVFSEGETRIQAYYDDCASEIPAGRPGRLEETVGAVLYLCSDLSSYETASTILVDGGLSMDGRTR